MNLSYEHYKSFLLKNYDHKYYLDTVGQDKYYTLLMADGSFSFECYINSIDHSTEIADFEANFLSKSNVKINEHFRFESSSNRQDVRIRQVNGDLKRTFIYATIGDENSLDNGGESDYTITCPDSTHTYIDFLPEHNYSLTGGSIKLLSTPSDVVKVSFLIAPNIPEEYGGNWAIVQNKKLLSLGDTFTEKVDSKFFSYNSEMPEASRTRLEIIHASSETANIEFCLEMFI